MSCITVIKAQLFKCAGKVIVMPLGTVPCNWPDQFLEFCLFVTITMYTLMCLSIGTP